MTIEQELARQQRFISDMRAKHPDFPESFEMPTYDGRRLKPERRSWLWTHINPFQRHSLLAVYTSSIIGLRSDGRFFSIPIDMNANVEGEKLVQAMQEKIFIAKIKMDGYVSERCSCGVVSFEPDPSSGSGSLKQILSPCDLHGTPEDAS
jgi:hypothetical protein